MKVKIKNGTKIYVLSLAYYKTGGLELLHQLVSQLVELGYDASIVYYNLRKKDNINPEFKKYVNRYLRFEDIDDNKDNILIVPETRIQALIEFKKIRKIIWWLSVDNYFPTISIQNHMKQFGFLKTIKHILIYHDIYKNWDLKSVADYHLVQSEYANLFLQNHGIVEIARLSDYLNDTYLEKNYDISRKKDIVLYNPAKGYSFTKMIIDKSQDLKWVPLENMTTLEVSEKLLEGKVYIDFGNHPGKDRFPREAAVSGCCIITGKKGAARNKVDIPIPEQYKFDEEKVTVDEIIDSLRHIIKNYNSEISNFKDYRNIIRKEKNEFVSDIVSIFING